MLKKLLLGLLVSSTGWAQEQRLIMVGGGKHPPKAMAQMEEWAGGDKAHILIIPWATVEPQENFQEAAVDLPRAKLELAPLAPLDAASRAQFVKQLQQATGVWFTGGDQVKIMTVLQDRPLLQALRDKYRAGTVFAGTSAGTAIMSLQMLTGEGDVTLLDGRQIEIKEGLGLLPEHIIVDQHFLKRQRENRLFGLILERSNSLGIGIDEDTALVLRNGKEAQVIGRAQVMLVQPGSRPHSLQIDVFQPGDSFQLPTARSR